MGLRLNHLSASHYKKAGSGGVGDKNALGVSGSAYFSPAGVAGAGDDVHAVRGFPGHPDAAYIFSGSIGGSDKSVFLGDVVVSGSLSLGSGGSFLEGSMTANRVPFAQDADTLIDDADLVFVAAGRSGSDSGGQGRLKIGDAAGDNVAIGLAADDIVFYADDESGDKHAGLVTNFETKLAITGSKTTGVSTEVGGIAGVILGQSGSANGFIAVRSLSSTVDAQNAGLNSQAAVQVKSDAGGVLLQSAADKKMVLQNAAGDLQIKLTDDSSTAANEKMEFLNTAGTAADSIKMRSVAGGLTMSGSGAVSVESDAGSITIGSLLTDGQAVNLGKPGAAEIILAPHGTPANEKISIINTSGAADDAILIDSVAGGLTLAAGDDSLKIDADGTDADALDIDSAGGMDVDVAGVLDIVAGDDSVIAVTTEAKDLALTVSGGGAQVLQLNSAGTGTGAIDINATGGGVEIDASSGVSLDAGAASNFTTSAGKLTLQGAGGEDVGVSGQTTTLKGQLNVDEAATFDNNVTISGNLDVNGTTTTIDSKNMTIEDSIIGLGVSGSDGTFSNVGDRAVIFARSANAHDALPALNWTGAKFELAKYLASPASSSMGTAASFADLKIGSLELDGGLAIPDDNASHTLSLVFDESEETANRTLNLKVFGGNRTLSLNESLTIGDGNDGTLTFSAASKTLQVEDDTAVNQDLTTDFAPTFLGVSGSAGHLTLNGAAAAGSLSKQVTVAATDSSDGAVVLDAAGGDVKLAKQGQDHIFIALGETGGPLFGPAGGQDLNFATMDDDKVVFVLDNDGGPSGHNTGSLRMHGTSAITFGDDSIYIHKRRTNFIEVVAPTVEIDGSTAVELQTPAVRVTDNAATVTIGTDQQFVLTHANSNNTAIVSTDHRLAFGAAGLSLSQRTSVGADHLVLEASSLQPDADNDVDLGAANRRFANIYTGDLNLRNDRGDWTLIEESDFISFRNNKTGRRFRMVMEDITGTGTYGPGNDGEM